MRPLPFVLAVAALLTVPAAGALGSTLVSPPTQAAYLVGYQDGAKTAVTTAVLSLGGTPAGAIDAIGVLEVRVPSTFDLAAGLGGVPGVAYVEKDVMTDHTGAQWNGAQWDGAQWNGAQWDTVGPTGTDPAASVQWGLVAANVPPAWAIDPGRLGSTLCVLDSGVDASHPDLAANMWTASDGSHGYNTIDGNTNTMDDAGHGTHMAGIAAAVHGNGRGVSGVANDLIMAVKVLDESGHGTTADLAEGMVWCADHGADVALMALSLTGEPKTITRALHYLDAHNVVSVASAGNQGPCTDCVTFPASAPDVIAVSALTEAGAPASFSSQGPQVALGAPGVSILSTFPEDAYMSGSGTSQAAAWVAGAATLLRDAHPGMSPQSVRAALVSSAHGTGAAGAGAGMLDVAGALATVG